MPPLGVIGRNQQTLPLKGPNRSKAETLKILLKSYWMSISCSASIGQAYFSHLLLMSLELKSAP